MKITPAKRVVPEDYKPEQRDLATKLAQTLNSFLDQVSTAFSKNLTLNDNLKSQTFSATMPVGVSKVTFTYTLNERPTTVLVGSISRKDGSAFTAAYSMVPTYTGTQIIANFIGLDAAKEHVVSITAQV